MRLQKYRQEFEMESFLSNWKKFFTNEPRLRRSSLKEQTPHHRKQSHENKKCI